MSRRNVAKPKKTTTQKKRPTPVDPETHAKSVRTRMLIVGVLLALAMGATLTRSAMLQTEDRSRLNREARRNYVSTEPFEARRGDISDRNGNLMAVTVHRWAITADPRYVTDIEETSRLLAGLIGRKEADVRVRLEVGSGGAELDDMGSNVAIEAAKRAVMPIANTVAEVVGFDVTRLERSIQLMTYFYQMEQLQDPGIYRVVKILDEAADVVGDLGNADRGVMRLFSRRGRKFTYIARDVDDMVANRVINARHALASLCDRERDEGRDCVNPLAHVRIRPEPRRYYPKREVAAQLLGLVNRQNRGVAGVERLLDGFLAASPHQLTRVKDRRGRFMYLHGLDPDLSLQPFSAQLSIDEKIQAYSEQIIQEACLVSGARAGYAVVYDVKTGEILASANYPTYNPNDYNTWHASRQPLRDERDAFGQAFDAESWAASSPMLAAAFPGKSDRLVREARASLRSQKNAFVEYEHDYPNASRSYALQEVYEPGSITKVFTVAAALEEKVIDLVEVIELEDGLWDLKDPDETQIRDTAPLSKGDVATIIKRSSNIGAAKIGLLLGSERVDRYLRAFGFGAKTGASFPGEARGTLRPSSSWTRVDLANVSFGQGFSVTGIQLAAAVGALANGGRLMRPILVKRIFDEHQRVVRTYEPHVVTQVVSEKTARTVLDLMQGVVEPGGTGTRAYIPEYPVAGKTGTGQKSHLRKRGYAQDMWVNTFFGVAPAGNPRLAVVILVDEPTGKRHGGGIFAAPAFRRIMRWSLKYLGVPSPYEAGKQVAWVDPHELTKRRAIKNEEARPDSKLAELTPPVKATEAGHVAVPTFVGMTMDQVRRLAHAASIQVTYHGSGLARGQDIPPHERVPTWTPVNVFFQPRGRVEAFVGFDSERWNGSSVAGGAQP